MTPQEAAARQEQVLGAPLRVAAIPNDDLTLEVRELVCQIGSTLGLEAPETLTTYFAVLAHHPEIFRLQLEMGIFLFAGSAIPPHERELAILRTAWLAGAPYEWSEHVAIGAKLGFTPEVSERVIAGPDAPGWTAHEAAILRAVDEMLGDRMISDPTWQVLAQSWSEKQLIELPCMIGQYFGVALLQNSLRMPLTPERKGFVDR